MAGFKVITYNIGNATALVGLLSILKLEKPQLVMLQEVTLSSDQISSQVAKYGYRAESNTDITNSYGYWGCVAESSPDK